MAYRIVSKTSIPENKIRVRGKPDFEDDPLISKYKENWKAFLCCYRCSNKEVDRFLTTLLGNYISSIELKRVASIGLKEMNELRRKHNIRAEKFKGKWYYSVDDLVRALKS